MACSVPPSGLVTELVLNTSLLTAAWSFIGKISSAQSWQVHQSPKSKLPLGRECTDSVFWDTGKAVTSFLLGLYYEKSPNGLRTDIF